MLSYYFYAANKVSESFVSLAVRVLLLYRKIFLMAFLNFDYNCLDFGHTRPPVLEKRSWFDSLLSAQVKNSIKTV